MNNEKNTAMLHDHSFIIKYKYINSIIVHKSKFEDYQLVTCNIQVMIPLW